MKFSRQECWSRLSFPSPGDLPDPGIKAWSLALQADSSPHLPPGKPNGRKPRGTKEFFDAGEKESEKAGLKLKIQNNKTMASGPITSWQIDGERWKLTEFTLLGSKITMNSDRSHEIKRCLLLGRKAMTNTDSILKSRDITLLTKVHIVKAMIFPVVMDRYES